ncbi:MAG: radical SAM protein [Planctomycetota bacterium]|jgi:predicted DNA-binding helix-hairpin-helix protein
MIGVVSKPGTDEKLEILSSDSQYDLACACGTNNLDRRKRGSHGKWVYPVSLPNGGSSVLFRTLISNVCNNDCKYCPLRDSMDVRRCSLSAEETARVFMDYYQQRKVFGLFLSSGVIGTPDNTMTRLNDTARILREKYRFRGYIHLKIIPGASNPAIKESVSLASAVSLNIETPGEKHLAKLSTRKRFIEDIIEPIRLISRLTARGNKYSRVKQTTQFIVGAAGENDSEIVKYTAALYNRLKMQRVYFSAYQKGLGDNSLPGEISTMEAATDHFVREHRLYQVDFLLRKYGFSGEDIVFDDQGNLVLGTDPKEVWAGNHPEYFPVRVNTASNNELLRVPGLGPVTVKRILERRKKAKIQEISDIGKPCVRLQKANQYLAYER